MTNEYEKQYIAQLLNDEELFNHTRILPKYLSNEINKKTYSYILEDYKENQYVNAGRILEKHNDFDCEYFIELYNEQFHYNTIENLKTLENIIIKDYKKRIQQDLNIKLSKNDITYEHFVEKVKQLDSIKLSTTETKMKTISDIDISKEEEKIYIKSGNEKFDKLVGGFILGELSVWSGGNASAKSTYLNQLAIESIDQGYNVVIYSGELTDKRLLNWILLQCAGEHNISKNEEKNYYYVNSYAKEKILKWLNNKLYIYDNNYGNKVQDILDSLTECIKRTNAKVIILDNLMSMNLSSYGDSKYDVQSKFVQDLSAIAKKYNVHIHFVCHPRKATTFLRKIDISGSADLTNIADNVFIMHRVNKDFQTRSKEMFGWKDSERIYQYSNVLEVCKNREKGVEDYFCGMYFNIPSKRLLNEETEIKRYGWENETNTRSIG